MKRIIYTSLLAFTSFILFSYSNGTFNADYIGNTGLGQSCSQIGCHDDGGGTQGVDTSRLLVKVLDAANTDVVSYNTGQQYNIEIRFKLYGCTKAGFECVAMGFPSNAKAGIVSNTVMPTLVQMYNDPSGREYMSHTSAGNSTAVISGGYATWKYKWTAPATGTEAVFFHVAVNRTNNDLLSTGDSSFIADKVLQKPSAISDLERINAISIYPNPCQEILNLTSINNTIDHVKLIDLFGRTVKEMQVSTLSTQLNTSNLSKGNYVLMFEYDGATYSKLITKQ